MLLILNLNKMSTNLLKMGKAGIMSLILCLAFTASALAEDWSGQKNYLYDHAIITDNINLTGNTTVNVASGYTVIISGVISSSGTYSLTKTGDGNLYLSNDNTYTGNTDIQQGILVVGSGETKGSVAGNIINNGELLFNHSGNYTYSGVISGTGIIYKEGAGTLYLIGNNTAFTGRTNIGLGVLSFGNGGAAGIIAGNIDVSMNGTLRFNRSDFYYYSGVISGTGNVYKEGNGGLYLTGDNTCTGTTYITAGELMIGSGAETGAIAGNINVSSGAKLGFSRSDDYTYNGVVSGEGSVYKYDGGTLYLTGNITGTVNTNVNGGTLTVGNNDMTGNIDGNISISSGATLRFNRSNDYTYSGVISGTAGFVAKAGSGTLYLTGVNTFTGATTVSSGTLSIGNGGETGGMADNSNISVSPGATLRFHRSNDYNYYGVISGTGTVTKKGDGILRLLGTNPFAGNTHIEEGSLILGGGGETGSIDGNINVSSEARFSFNRSNAHTYSGVISGSGMVTKNGSGTLTLTGNHTATGTFNCSSGALVLAGDWAGNFVKNTALTVTGNRTIGGTLTMQGGDTYMDLGATTPSRLSVTGALTVSIPNTIRITALGAESSYTLISAASGVSTTNFAVTGAAGTLSATSTQLTFTPFFPVTDIAGLPATATATLPLTLTGTVVPSNATNQTIVWSVSSAGSTGASISGGNILNTTAAGTATVKAAIANGASPMDDFEKEFTIAVSKAPQTAPAEPALASSTSTSITLNPVTGCEYRRYDGAWQPSNVFTGLTPGTSYGFIQRYVETATYLASPESPVATFSTTVPEHIPVTNIIDVPTEATAGVPLELTATVVPGDATHSAIVWTIHTDGGTGAAITGDILNTANEGTVKLTATITDGKAEGMDYTQDFDITVAGETGIDEITAAQIKIYPNPTSGQLRITNYNSGITNVEIFDSTGRSAGAYPCGSPEIPINISHLPSGVYFVKLSFETGGWVQKIIKE